MNQYLQLLQKIQSKGTFKPAARENMPGTISLFGPQMEFDLQEGFPLLTTKKMYWKGIVVELLWFLRGDTNIKYLIDNGVNIWNEDAYQYYCKLCKKYSLLPYIFDEFINRVKEGYNGNNSIIGSTENILLNKEHYKIGNCGYQYGKIWRNWELIDSKVNLQENGMSYWRKVDQIKNLIDRLKNSPESRRHLVTAIDPGHDEDLALYWCHAMFQFNCRPIDDVTRAHWAINNNKMHRNELMFDIIENPERTLKQQLDENNIPKYYLDCKLYQRSADVVLGVPFNTASYALLTHILSSICNMVPGEFIHSFGDVHIYENHLDAVNEQLQRIPKKLPLLKFQDKFQDKVYAFNNNSKKLNDLFNDIEIDDFILENYNPYPKLENETKLSTGLK